MTSAPLPLTNVGSGYTIGTKVVSPLTVSSHIQRQLQKFLKGEPKALGVVQIMIGVLTILFGIVMAVPAQTISVFSGIVFWGSFLHISAGSVAVAASNKLKVRMVKAAVGVNIMSTIHAGTAIVIHSVDLVNGTIFGGCNYYDNSFGCRNNYVKDSRTKGITGVLLVFSLLQFAVSIAVLVFACKATCKATCNNTCCKPTVNTIIVVQNRESGVPVVPSIPVYQAQPGVSTMNNMAMCRPPMESPPAYCEKGEANN